jgi:hypothetical protein
MVQTAASLFLSQLNMSIHTVSRLASLISAAGIPIDGVSSGPPIRVDYQETATPAQKAQGAAIVAAFDFSDTADAAWLSQAAKAAAATGLDLGTSPTERLIRALALVVLDEVNTIRTGLSLSPRTVGQLISAIKAKVAATAE